MKRTLCIILAVCIVASMAVIATVSASANAGDEIRRYDVTQIVNADPEKQVNTKTYYFYMPTEWRNEYNDNYDGKDLASCTAGIYWWDGSYNCSDYQGKQSNAWPGYGVKETEAADANIFKAAVPEDVPKIIWNNLVDGGEDKSAPVYKAAIRSQDISTKGYSSSFYPNGVENFDGMIFVCEPFNAEESDINQNPTYKGDWFYYYGNGEYGIYETREEASIKNGIFSKGDFPKTADEKEPDNHENTTCETTAPQETTVPVENETENTEPATKDTIVENKNMIYFNAFRWKNVTNMYCHIWKRGGNSFFGWQSKKEKCKRINGDIWGYDLSVLASTDESDLQNSLKKDVDYCIIFSAVAGDNYYQTYDATFGTECIGDALQLTEDNEKIESPVDSEKSVDNVEWTDNKDKYGPHLALTSIGNIVGKFLCPNEKGTEVIGDWLAAYYKSKYVNPVYALANAFPKFGIKTASDLTDVYKYIVSKKTGEDEKTMKDILENAFVKAYPDKVPGGWLKLSNPVKVKAVNKIFKAKTLKKKSQSYTALKVTGAKGKVTYKVTKKNKKLAFKSGKITVKKGTKKGIYKLTVKVTAAGNSSYAEKAVTTIVKVTVK